MSILFTKDSPYYKLEIVNMDFSEDDYDTTIRKNNMSKVLSLEKKLNRTSYVNVTKGEERNALIIDIPQELDAKVSSIRCVDVVDNIGTENEEVDSATIQFEGVTPDEYSSEYYSMFFQHKIMYRIYLGYTMTSLEHINVFSSDSSYEDSVDLVFQGIVNEVETSYNEDGMSVTLNLKTLEEESSVICVPQEALNGRSDIVTYLDLLNFIADQIDHKVFVQYPGDVVAAESLYKFLTREYFSNKPWESILFNKYSNIAEKKKLNEKDRSTLKDVLEWFAKKTECTAYIKNGVVAVGYPGTEIEIKSPSKLFKYGMSDKIDFNLSSDPEKLSLRSAFTEELLMYDTYNSASFNISEVNQGGGSRSDPIPRNPVVTKTKKTNEAHVDSSWAYLEKGRSTTLAEYRLANKARIVGNLLKKREATKAAEERDKKKKEIKKEAETSEKSKTQNTKMNNDGGGAGTNADRKTKDGSKKAADEAKDKQELKKAGITVKRLTASIEGLIGDPFLHCRELFSTEGFLPQHNNTYSIGKIIHNIDRDSGYTMDIEGWSDKIRGKKDKTDPTDPKKEKAKNKRKAYLGITKAYIADRTQLAKYRLRILGINLKNATEEEIEFVLNNRLSGFSLTGPAKSDGTKKPNPPGNGSKKKK